MFINIFKYMKTYIAINNGVQILSPPLFRSVCKTFTYYRFQVVSIEMQSHYRLCNTSLKD